MRRSGGRALPGAVRQVAVNHGGSRAMQGRWRDGCGKGCISGASRAEVAPLAVPRRQGSFERGVDEMKQSAMLLALAILLPFLIVVALFRSAIVILSGDYDDRR